MSPFFTPGNLASLDGGFFKPPGSGSSFSWSDYSWLISQYKAGHASNTTTSVNVNFAPSAVNTTTDKITLADQGFRSRGEAFPDDPAVFATPVYFSSSGTLPAPLQTNTRYYVEWDGTSAYTVYAEPSGNDYQEQPYALNASAGLEPYLSAQNFAQAVNKVNLTSQGTGTHTMYTDTLTSTLKDWCFQNYGFDCNVQNTSNKHTMYETVTDGNGNSLWRLRLNSRQVSLSAYNIQGKYAKMNDGTNGRKKLYSKRALCTTYVIKPNIQQTRSYPKAFVTQAKISGSTITSTNKAGTNHPFNTSNTVANVNLVNVVASPVSTGTIPPEYTGDMYVRSLSATTFALYPTANDAANNTNVITPTTSATDSFIIYAPARVGDYSHWNVMSLVYGPDQDSALNASAPRLHLYGPIGSGILAISGNVSVSGTTNGEFFVNNTNPNFQDTTYSTIGVATGTISYTSGSTTVTGSGTSFLTTYSAGDVVFDYDNYQTIGRVSSIASDTSLTLTASFSGTSKTNVRYRKVTPTPTKVYIWFPPRAVPPTKNDGNPLTEGYYWISRKPGNCGRIRLHTTEADAISGVGLFTNVTGCIKFNNVAQSGEMFFEYGDGKARMSTNIRPAFGETTAIFQTTIDTDKLTAISFLVDYNDPAETYPVMRIIKNGVHTETFEYRTGTKGNLPADDGSTFTAWIIGGDLEPHGPFNGDMAYSDIGAEGASGIPVADVIEIHQLGLMPEYGVA